MNTKPTKKKSDEKWTLVDEKKTPNTQVVSALNAGRGPLRRARRTRRTGKRGVPNLPPRIEIVGTVDFICRFRASNTLSQAALTRRSMCAMLGGVCTVANTTVTMIMSTFRIRAVMGWSATNGGLLIDVPPTQAGAEQALNKDSSKSTELPSGITSDTAVVWRPKRGTLLDMWQAPGNDPTDQLLAISGPSGSVIDFHVTATLAGCTSASLTYTTSSTVAVSVFGRTSADTGNLLTPVGYTQFNF